jgi:triosephosphate isomerase
MPTRRYLVGMSTKMYFSHARTIQWCQDVAKICLTHPAMSSGAVELFVLPGFLSISDAAKIIPSVGAQDVSWAEEGAYTGEVSAAQLAEIGATYVEVGHAERRRYFHEDDHTIAAKMAAILRQGLTPVLCVGETERAPIAETIETCLAQASSALSLARTAGHRGRVIVAYEPVWAIGAAEPADVAHITDVCGPLRELLADDPDYPAAVIYGGSAGPGLLRQVGKHLDGLFLGRFAHDPQAIAGILDDIGFLIDDAAAPSTPAE